MEWMTYMCTSLIVGLTLHLILLINWLHKKYLKLQFFQLYGIPGPEPRFLVGNLTNLRQANPHEVISVWLKQYGNIFGYFYGSVPHLVVKDLDILKTAMVKESHIFVNRPKMSLQVKPFIYNILFLRDQRWKDVRKALTPAFSTNKIKHMNDIMLKKVDIFLNNMDSYARQRKMFDIYESYQALTLDVIGECALAMNVQCQQDKKDPFLVSVKEFFLHTNNKVVQLAYIIPPLASILTFVGNHMTAGRMTSMIVNNLQKVINIRRKSDRVQSVDFLQLMLDAAESSNLESNQKKKTLLTDDEIIGNAHVFLLAGFETTATALGFTTYLLVKHPDVQERVYQEIMTNIGLKDNMSYEDIQGLSYLDQVFNESLRMYPPVTTFISRECEEDVTINGQFIPKGIVLEAPIWDIHHDPDLWPEPWKFNPERFSSENKQKINSTAFMPFGIGPRNCIGMRFAQLEAKLALTSLIRKYKIVRCEKTQDPLKLVCPTVVINPSDGIYVRLVPRI